MKWNRDKRHFFKCDILSFSGTMGVIFPLLMIDALSPLDGRYSSAIDPLKSSFSEEALIFFRIFVEIRWFSFLSDREDISPLRPLKNEEKQLLESILKNFSTKDAERVKEIEATTRHDVKAVEYFLKEKIANSSLESKKEWIHFALTSEDVNNLAYALMIQNALKKTLLPEIQNTEDYLFSVAKEWKSIPLLSRTHGQPASPTTLGKEFLIFAMRLQRQRIFLEEQEILGKCAGASGNLNAHIIAFPEADWLDISEQFVKSLGLIWNPVVPQIEPHDFLAEISHTMIRINTIVIDLSRDTWGYIALKFFRQKTKPGEVGSSAMPHKVNPIDFENAEGNMGLANALFSHFAEKLPISRWQRDLTDSTVLRNMGVAFGHHFLALKSLKRGLEKLQLNESSLQKDLKNTPEVLAEAIQTVMRAEEIENPYEQLKEMSRGKEISLEVMRDFVRELKISEAAKKRLLGLTPGTYIGLAEEIVDRFAK